VASGQRVSGWSSPAQGGMQRVRSSAWRAGFVKGIGRGLVGVAAQPVSGALDFMSSAFEGIDVTSGALRARLGARTIARARQRLPRAIGGDRRLLPFLRSDGTDRQARARQRCHRNAHTPQHKRCTVRKCMTRCERRARPAAAHSISLSQCGYITAGAYPAPSRGRPPEHEQRERSCLRPSVRAPCAGRRPPERRARAGVRGGGGPGADVARVGRRDRPAGRPGAAAAARRRGRAGRGVRGALPVAGRARGAADQPPPAARARARVRWLRARQPGQCTRVVRAPNRVTSARPGHGRRGALVWGKRRDALPGAAMSLVSPAV